MTVAAKRLHDRRVHKHGLGTQHGMNAVTRELHFVPEIRQRVLSRIDVSLGKQKTGALAYDPVKIDYWIVGAADGSAGRFATIVFIIPANTKGPPMSSNVRRATSNRIFICNGMDNRRAASI